MQITTGTRWARTGNASASRRARAAEAAPGKAARVERITSRRATRQVLRLLRGEISSCGGAGAAWRGVGTRAFRSEIARCHAGGPRLSRPYPRRPRRGAAGRSAPGAGRRDVGPYHRSQPRSRPSHVPAPATSPPQPRSRRGFGGGAVRPVSESGGKRALCAGWVLCGGSPRRFPQGPEMFFPSRLLGSGGKSG